MKAREIADLVGGELHGDGEVHIFRASEFMTAHIGSLAFLEKTEVDSMTEASCVLLPLGTDTSGCNSAILVKNPKLAFAKAAALLHPPKSRPAEIHPSAVIAEEARIGEGVFIGAFVTVGEGSSVGDGSQLRAGTKIGDNVHVGANCVIHPNVTIDDHCSVGENVILHSGVVIGADGFGYVKDEVGDYVKFPQIGTVVIEDNVEIGANTCIDRGALGETRIGAGTKIDNLVQVGHNVSIGERCVIAAQTGISGSVIIEDDCVIGGQVGFGDHVRVQSGAIIGSQAGVLPGKIVRPGAWWGTPIQPLDEYKKLNAQLKGIGRLKASVDELRKKIER